MSWIARRPEAKVLSKWYEKEISFYSSRRVARPGIVGWAGIIQEHVAELDDVKGKCHFDFYYVKHFSPLIKMLFAGRAAEMMLTGFGAK